MDKNNKPVPCISTILTVLLIALFASMSMMITGCGTRSSEDEMGTIEDVVIEGSSQENDDSDKNIFTSLDVPYGYRVETVENGMAYAKFKIPSSYTSYTNNARHIELEAPADDPTIPSATFHMLYDFASYGMALDDGTITEDSASDYVDRFAWELPQMYYNTGSGRCCLRQQELPDKSIAVTGISKNKSDIYCTIADGVDLKTSSEDPGPSGYSQVTIYYNWQSIPCCISTVVPKDKTDVAKKIMTYIVSTTTYLPSRIDTAQTYDIRNKRTISLPSGMLQIDSSSKNVFMVPVDRTADATAGIAVGVYKIDLKETPALTKKTMNSDFANQIARSLCYNASSYNIMTSSDVSGSGYTIAGRKAKHYITTVSLVGSAGNENNPLAGSFFGDPGIAYIDTLTYKTEKTQHVLSIMYQAHQRQSAMRILNMAASSIDISN